MDGLEIALSIIRDAEAIERAKDSRALTPEETRTVKAGAFLRQILPVPQNDGQKPKNQDLP